MMLSRPSQLLLQHPRRHLRRHPPRLLLPPRRPRRKSNLLPQPRPLFTLRRPLPPRRCPSRRHTSARAPPGPEVTTVEPPRVGPGFDMDLKITGKNFVQGAKVSFANPGIRVMGVTSPSSTELTVHIKVARDAAPGVASLYVINPDDREVEAPFEVTGKGTAHAYAPRLHRHRLPPRLPPTRNVMMLSIWEILRRSFRFTAR